MLKKFGWIFILGFIVAFLNTPVVAQAQETAQAAAVHQPDPSGTATGNATDVPAAKTGEPTMPELVNAAGHNRVAINIVWTLIAGFLVMFMQPGFTMVETGFTRAKNAVHTMAMNLMIYPLGMLSDSISAALLSCSRPLRGPQEQERLGMERSFYPRLKR
jgi:Amt family ammonium transporter